MTWASEQWATRFPPPHVRGIPSQARTLTRIVDRLDHLSECGRAVLRILCDEADGAGIAYPKVATLVRLSGCPRSMTYRALRDLDAAELVERYPTLRDPERFAHRRNPRARRGQGVTIYRLGRSLRVSAGLIEMNMSDHLGLVPRGPQNRSVRPPKPRRDPRTDAGLRPVSGEARLHDAPDELGDGARETPKRDPLDHDESPARQGVSSSRRETPGTKELEETLVTTTDVEPSSSVVDDAHAREAETTDRLIAALARPPEQPSPFVSPLDRDEPANEDELTLDDVLADPDLFAVYVAPYGELVENETAAPSRRPEVSATRPLDAASAQPTPG